MTKDRLKEEIGLFKLLMAVALAMFTSIIGCIWGASQTTILKTIILFLVLLVLSSFIIYLFLKIDLKIKELDYYE